MSSLLKSFHSVIRFMVGIFLPFSARQTVAQGTVPAGAIKPAVIINMKYLHDGSGTKGLVPDPDYGQVLETAIKPSGGTQRSEFVIHHAQDGAHMYYEFRARHIAGTGALVNQWHQPTGDGKGPAASYSIRRDSIFFSYFHNGTKKSIRIQRDDDTWHTYGLYAGFSKGSSGYFHVYWDGKYLFSSYGDNSKPTGTGGQFKLGTYSGPKNCRMHYAYALVQVRKGPPSNPKTGIRQKEATRLQPHGLTSQINNPLRVFDACGRRTMAFQLSPGSIRTPVWRKLDMEGSINCK